MGSRGPLTSLDDAHSLHSLFARSKSRSNTHIGQEYEQQPWSSGSDRFQAIPDKEDSAPSTAGTSRTTNPTPIPEQTLAQATLSPMSDSDTLRATDMNALAPYNYPSQYAQYPNHHQGQQQNAGPLSPRSTAAAASAYNLDPSILQTTIGSLLQSPAAAQMFLNSLNNSVQGQTLNTPHPAPNGQPSFPFPNQDTQHSSSTSSSSQQRPSSFPNAASGQEAADPTLALFSPLPNHSALVNHSDQLQRSYQGAADMSQDVDKLQESIDSLVRSMGLEPNSSNANADASLPPPSQGLNGGGMSGAPGGGVDDFDLGVTEDDFGQNFDVDQFLTELARSEEQIQKDEKPQI